MRGDYVALRAASKKVFRRPEEDLGDPAGPDC